MDATLGLPILVWLIAVALLFDFLNGLHDSANSIATVVATRVLRPATAHLAGKWLPASTPRWPGIFRRDAPPQGDQFGTGGLAGVGPRARRLPVPAKL